MQCAAFSVQCAVPGAPWYLHLREAPLRGEVLGEEGGGGQGGLKLFVPGMAEWWGEQVRRWPIVECTVSGVQCVVYSEWCTVCSVQCVAYSV